ncbi:S26 family signal peptidase [Hoeflea sp.]|uniref:S26 family signal peptidase n=1 Tax=Hoeflea sp. TaxID=1940281 RepID=UPI003B020E7C
MAKQRSAALSLCAAGCLLITVSAIENLPTKLVWNASVSVPVGLYSVSRTPPERGDLVLATLPEHARQIADRRGYLPSKIPALKRVVALAGDTVCRFGRVVFVNGKPTAKAKLSDARGLKMPRWRGCFKLGSGQVFLLGDHRDSFDGRYFGVGDLAHVQGVARPLWINAK